MRKASGGSSSDAVGGTCKSYDTRKLLDLIKDRCPSYGIVTSNLRGQMRLIVLALKGLAEEISNVYVNAENTGIGNVLANKVGLCLSLFVVAMMHLERSGMMRCSLTFQQPSTMNREG